MLKCRVHDLMTGDRFTPPNAQDPGQLWPTRMIPSQLLLFFL